MITETATRSRHLSTLTLHQLRYGELSGEQLRETKRHLQQCDRCSARLRYQEQERAAFALQPIPPAILQIASGETARATARETRPTGWRRWLSELAPFATAAAAAAAVLLIVPSSDPIVGPAPDPATFDGAGVTTKGQLPDVEAWVDSGTGLRLLRSDDVLGAGSRVQLGYDPHGASYIALAGRDGSGAVEIYTTDAPTGVGLVRAPFALTLDDAPGVQELFVVGGDVPLDARLVTAAVTTGVPGIRVAKIAIDKRD